MVLIFPYPGYWVGGRSVIASCPYDDERGEVALVLLLDLRDPAIAHYTVAHYALTDFDPKLADDDFLHDGTAYEEGELDVLGEFVDIVLAVAEYEQNGGD